MKKKHQKPFFLIIFAVIILLLTFGVDGYINYTQTQLKIVGNNLLPPFRSSLWQPNNWNSQSIYPTNAAYDIQPNSVTLSQKNDKLGVSAVGYGYGVGPDVLKWNPIIDCNISLNKKLYFTITTKLENLTVTSPFGWSAFGVDFWLDAKTPDGKLLPLELYIHFHESGIYTLPIGAYNHFGQRQDYDYNKMNMGTPWHYTYFHFSQDNVGQTYTHQFIINDFTDTLKRTELNFRNIQEFFIKRVDICQEFLYAEGSFTIYNLDLKEVQ